MDFFTTQYVMASSEGEAITIGLNTIETEIHRLLPNSRWHYEATEAWEENDRLPEEGVGSGYTWYRS
jgi:hypothetical protein